MPPVACAPYPSSAWSKFLFSLPPPTAAAAFGSLPPSSTSTSPHHAAARLSTLASNIPAPRTLIPRLSDKPRAEAQAGRPLPAMSVPGVASPAADRFYCPPPRRHLLNKQKQQQNPSPPVDAAPEQPERPTPELRGDTPPSPPPAAATNLESFIASTAVRVPARRLPLVRSSLHRAPAPAALSPPAGDADD